MYLFWLEVQEFKNGTFIAPNHGGYIQVREDEIDEAIMNRRAQLIINKYIVSDSPSEINIPYTIKIAIPELLKNNFTSGLSLLNE